MSDDPLEELRAEYRAGLPERFARLQKFFAEVESGRAPAARVGELHRELHSLAGSGKTFGFPGITELARAGEALLEPYKGGAAAPGATELAQLKRLLDSLPEAAR